MALWIDLAVIFVLLAAIVYACTLFTNAVEWLGHRLNLSEGAVGSVLAAVGTALPETLVPIIALLSAPIQMAITGQTSANIVSQGEHIGIGAILGAPFLLSTLALCLTGLAVIYFARKGQRGIVMHLDLHLFKRDLHYFFPAYATVFIASFIHVYWVKVVLGCGLLALYGVYVYRTLKIEHIPDAEFDLDALLFQPKALEPKTPLILLQLFAGLALIIILAHLFVDKIHHVSEILHISPLILSLIIAPIATELPEKFNSVVWISKKKDNLALGNITGAMVFQSCIPPFVGLCFTPWVLDYFGSLSVMLCFASVGLIYFAIIKKRMLQPQYLVLGGVFYLVFIAQCIWQIITEGKF
jgi:cation:H+ antiporter